MNKLSAPFVAKGKPFYTRDGGEVYIFVKQEPIANYPIEGILRYPNMAGWYKERICHWTEQGNYYMNESDHRDIIDLPASFIINLNNLIEGK